MIITLLLSSFAVVYADGEETAPVTLESDTPMALERMPEVFYGTPKVDGVKDEKYTEAPQLHIGKCIEGSPDGSTGDAWVLWDYSHIYVYAEVTEASFAANGADEYLKDSVEVFLDCDLSKSKATDANDAQYRVTITSSHSNGLNAPTEFEGVAITDEAAGTYTVEMACNIVDILPADGTIMGFEMQINDANSAGKRTSVMKWYSDYGDDWENTSHYGAIVLRLGNNYAKWNQTTPLKISVNGYLLNTGNTPPVVVSDRTLVPMRVIFEALGAGVAWNDAEQAVYVIGNKKLIIMKIGSTDVLVNGETVVSDVPIQTINDRTMVPVRFVSDLLGAEVNYDEIQGAVFVNKGK